MHLVTGAGGFLGRALVRALRAAGEEVLAPAHDIRDRAAWLATLRAARPAVIHHLAGQSRPPLAFPEARDTFSVNVLGTVALLEAARDAGADPLVLVASSGTAYGPAAHALREEEALRPATPYAASKAAQDLAAAAFGPAVRVVRARIFTTIGPGKPGDVCTDFARRVRAIAATGARQGVLRTGNLQARRALLDLEDAVAAWLLLARHGAPGEAYNISAAHPVAMSALLPHLEEASGIALRAEPDPALFRPADESLLWGDTARLRAATGWAPRIPLAESVRRIYANPPGA
ncbi:NAD-dependent epimerase/dehydratase family protein [Roseococcus sp. DSY-14]|uniref:NAD-dependent epimerase/dehydratase family protein n=1 Tax=Roseococcus sp. DSY-14 TaxID=3369650 RepID=UPI00387ADD29